MTPSTRYATAVLLLLALTAVPTVLHSYIGSTVADGHSAKNIPMRLGDEYGAPTSRRAGWGEDRLSSFDWAERTYASNPTVKLFVGRSYDLKKLYHHPELAVDYGQAYESHETMSLPGRSDVAVHVLRGGMSNPQRLALYVLEYEGAYVADPIWFQLRTSLELLFSRRSAMTIFFAAQDLPSDGAPETSRAARLLRSAVEAFESQTRQ